MSARIFRNCNFLPSTAAIIPTIVSSGRSSRSCSRCSSRSSQDDNISIFDRIETWTNTTAETATTTTTTTTTTPNSTIINSSMDNTINYDATATIETKHRERKRKRKSKKSKRNRPLICSYCHESGHAIRDLATGVMACPQIRVQQCSFCGETGDYGHNISRCPWAQYFKPFLHELDPKAVKAINKSRIIAEERRRARLSDFAASNTPTPAAMSSSDNIYFYHHDDNSIFDLFGIQSAPNSF